MTRTVMQPVRFNNTATTSDHQVVGDARTKKNCFLAPPSINTTTRMNVRNNMYEYSKSSSLSTPECVNNSATTRRMDPPCCSTTSKMDEMPDSLEIIDQALGIITGHDDDDSLMMGDGDALLSLWGGEDTDSSSCFTNSTEDAPQQQQQQREEPRTVRFAAYDDVLEIPHINDLSSKEIGRVWMNQDELDGIRETCLFLVKMMDEDVPEVRGLCLRGLEPHVSVTKRSRKALQEQIYNAVYRIQSFEGVEVSEFVSALCQRYSSEAVATAHEVGIDDYFQAATAAASL